MRELAEREEVGFARGEPENNKDDNNKKKEPPERDSILLILTIHDGGFRDWSWGRDTVVCFKIVVGGLSSCDVIFDEIGDDTGGVDPIIGDGFIELNFEGFGNGSEGLGIFHGSMSEDDFAS